jgi:hypothetical protein
VFNYKMASDTNRSESATPSANDVWQTESEDTNDDDMDYEVRELYWQLHVNLA